MARWVSTAQFASLFGLTRQAAHKAAKRAAAGSDWRGKRLRVREAKGKGGRSGSRFEIDISGVSEADYGTENDVQIAADQMIDRKVPASDQGERISERLSILENAIALPSGTRARADALALASQSSGYSLRTLQRWMRDLDDHGGDANALARRRPSDAGTRRVLVSRKFDQALTAAGYDRELLIELADKVDEYTRHVWASPRQRSGWRMVRRDIVTFLKRECANRDIRLPQSAFYLARRRIMQAEHFRRVDIYLNDRKRFDDQKPRIRRDNSKLLPMEQIVMDVKPVDVVMLRPDGSTVWPRLIGFMDTGTHRTFCHFVALPKGEGVRQEHVTRAFLEMVQHPEWGFPQQLYRDNGSEFFHLDKIRAALELVQIPGRPTIINARPYSGASKPIESKFAVLDRYVFNQFEGWAGGDRLNKKTQTVGKPTAPYSKSFDEFVAEADRRLRDFETIELLTGPFKGRSPSQILDDHIRSGWRPVRVDPLALDAAFCDRISRKVDRGFVSIDGERYSHPELSAQNGRSVQIAISWRRGALPLVNLKHLGWAQLEPEMLHFPGDISGAVESGRNQKRERQSIRQLMSRSKTPAFDPLDDRLAELPSRAAPAPLVDILMSEEAQQLAQAKHPSPQVIAFPSPAKRLRDRRMTETEELERYLANKS